MKNVLNSLVIAALIGAAVPAQAAIQEFDFSGAMDSGYYDGQSFAGNFSFDDAALTSIGEEYIDVSSLSFDFLSTVFSESDYVYDAPSVAFYDGEFLGLSWDVDSTYPDVAFSFIPGFFDASDAYVAYDTGLGLSGAGDVIYAPVPEADTYAMLLAGLGLLGFAARRRNA